MKKNKAYKNEKDEKGNVIFYTEEIKKNKSINEDTVKIISFIVILIIVLGLFFGLFLLNKKYISKDDKQKEETTTTTTTTTVAINLNQTIVDDMFSLDKKATYYVLAYDSEDEISGTSLYNKAKSANIKDIKVYTLDLNNAMNKKHYNPNKNEVVKTTKASEVNFKTNTLVIFKKGKVAEYITNKEEIIKKLSQK